MGQIKCPYCDNMIPETHSMCKQCRVKYPLVKELVALGKVIKRKATYEKFCRENNIHRGLK